MSIHFYKTRVNCLDLHNYILGKTCLLIRFKDDTFLMNNFISTVGIDYRNKMVEVDKYKVKLQ